MYTRFVLRLVLIVAAMLGLTTPALAGGWAVVTLDELPGQVFAGEPLSVGFKIRQHGRTPLRSNSVMVRAEQVEGGAVVETRAQGHGPVGHYMATLVFPHAGLWNWTIASGLLPDQQPMPALTVLAYAPSLRPNTPGMVSLAMIMLTEADRILVANDRARGGMPAPVAKPAELGEALFLAKGCVVCHTHNAVRDERRAFADFSIGPNLSYLMKNDPAFLHRWLKDPSAIRPGTAMPTLGLSDVEIDSLVAFLLDTAGQ